MNIIKTFDLITTPTSVSISHHLSDFIFHPIISHIVPFLHLSLQPPTQPPLQTKATQTPSVPSCLFPSVTRGESCGTGLGQAPNARSTSQASMSRMMLMTSLRWLFHYLLMQSRMTFCKLTNNFNVFLFQCQISIYKYLFKVSLFEIYYF